MSLKNRTAIITGASQGLGFEIARAFITAGAKVVLCAREAKALEKACADLQTNAQAGSVFAQPADVSNPAEVDALVHFAQKALGKIDILVANAGVYGPKGPLQNIDWDAWSDTIDINLKGTVYICKALLPHFKQNHYGKIILLSGGGATKPLPALSAYAASKAAVVRFGETLAEEVRADHIDVNSVAPGALNTRLLNEILDAGPEKVGETFYQQALKQKDSGGTSLHIAAELCVYLASSESDGVTGKLISAVWDPWKELHTRISALSKSDLYTLRRVDS